MCPSPPPPPSKQNNIHMMTMTLGLTLLLLMIDGFFKSPVPLGDIATCDQNVTIISNELQEGLVTSRRYSCDRNQLQRRY